MFDSYLFIGLLAITVSTLGIVAVQIFFEFGEVKKRKLQERLSGEAERYQASSAYAPISLQQQKQDAVALALSQFSFFSDFDRKFKQAYPNVVFGRFIILTLGIAATVAAFIVMVMGSLIAAILVAAAIIAIRFWIVLMKFNKRQRQMNDQLPDALEFLARILRAGHSLATGLQMGGDELPEPLASEFRRCYDQHSLGQTLEVGMRDMAGRVGTSDFAFFVTAVLIQRQTGGDLAEVLGNISGMVRARIRLQQHVKAITAEGRLVGYILLVLPVVFWCIMYALNPEYAGVLIYEREGIYMLSVALVMQLLGLITIKRIVSVKM
jgi:tight adherence protein B